MGREHVWVGLCLSWLCALAFAIREVLELYLGQLQLWVDQIGFGWCWLEDSGMGMCQMMKRIDTFGLVSAWGIYTVDITLISVLKDKTEKRRKEKGLALAARMNSRWRSDNKKRRLGWCRKKRLTTTKVPPVMSVFWAFAKRPEPESCGIWLLSADPKANSLL